MFLCSGGLFSNQLSSAYGVDELKVVLKEEARLASTWDVLENERDKLRDECLKMKKQLDSARSDMHHRRTRSGRRYRKKCTFFGRPS